MVYIYIARSHLGAGPAKRGGAPGGSDAPHRHAPAVPKLYPRGQGVSFILRAKHRQTCRPQTCPSCCPTYFLATAAEAPRKEQVAPPTARRHGRHPLSGPELLRPPEPPAGCDVGCFGPVFIIVIVYVRHAADFAFISSVRAQWPWARRLQLTSMKPSKQAHSSFIPRPIELRGAISRLEGFKSSRSIRLRSNRSRDWAP